jgi:hypothetical protein
MAISDTARAKARAAVSDAQADVASLSAQLNAAKRALGGSDTASDLLDSVSDVNVVGSLTSGLRDNAQADRAKRQADVDRLTAQLESAKNKLARAQKAESALLSVVGPDDDSDDD